MNVFKLLINIFFLETVITTTIVALHQNVNFDSILFHFWTHPVNLMNWFHNLLNTFDGKMMPAARYESLFTTNAKDTLKSDALNVLDEWTLYEAQMVSDHDICPPEKVPHGQVVGCIELMLWSPGSSPGPW